MNERIEKSLYDILAAIAEIDHLPVLRAEIETLLEIQHNEH